MSVSDNVYSAIETTLTKIPALNGYTEIIPKTFVMFTGSKGWDHEEIFNREHNRKFAVEMTTNEAFLGSN